MKAKSHFLTFHIKDIIIPSCFILFTICLVIFSKENLSATKDGLALWFNAVVPSLLPFFIATELLSHTTIVSSIGTFLNCFMRPLFNVPGIGAYAFIMGIISGYPVGAKIVTEFRNNKLCTKAEGERLLAFTNNSGPLFILGTVGISLFGNVEIGILLFLTHFISSILVGFSFRFWKVNDKEKVELTKYNNNPSNTQVTFSNLGEILASSIMNAIHSVVLIGGFVVLFSVVLSILNNSGIFLKIAYILSPILEKFNISSSLCTAVISGIIEVTNGVKLISQIPIKAISIILIFTSFLLGFGGFSVLLQVLSITSKSDLSIKAYFIGKLLHGTIAAILTYFFIHIFPIFQFDIAQTFSSSVEKIVPIGSYFNFSHLCIGLLFVTVIIFISIKKRKQYKI